MAGSCSTCTHVYVSHYDFLCCHDYSACYGQDKCRYPEVLRAMGINPSQFETKSDEVKIESSPLVVPSSDPPKITRKHVFNPALRAENKVHSGHPLFYWWSTMCHACYNYRSKSYAYTGGKGIRVHPDWHKAETFIRGFASYNKMTDKMLRLDRNLDFDPDNYVIMRGESRIYFDPTALA